MGASNVAAAYAKYAGKVPPLSMVLLAYMALVSKDADERPWYSQGHAGLANGALGRDMPISEADIRAVERAIGPLLRVGAITADRRPAHHRAGPKTCRYRLNLNVLPIDVHRPKRPTDSVGRQGGTSHGFRGSSGGNVPRKPWDRGVSNT